MNGKQGLKLSTRADHGLRRFRECAWPGDPLDSPRVRNWQKAKRITLAALLGFSALHYYFADVQLAIMALPNAGVAVPSSWLASASSRDYRCGIEEERCRTTRTRR